MKHHMYMSTKELLETFGKGPKGKRKVSSDMVRWLLSEPPRHLIDVAKILKEPVVLKIDPECPPGKVFLMPNPVHTFRTELSDQLFNFEL